MDLVPLRINHHGHISTIESGEAIAATPFGEAIYVFQKASRERLEEHYSDLENMPAKTKGFLGKRDPAKNVNSFYLSWGKNEENWIMTYTMMDPKKYAELIEEEKGLLPSKVESLEGAFPNNPPIEE